VQIHAVARAGFNPHPARRPGDAKHHSGGDGRRLVSIRTRPGGRVMQRGENALFCQVNLSGFRELNQAIDLESIFMSIDHKNGFVNQYGMCCANLPGNSGHSRFAAIPGEVHRNPLT
jgi:hypothetical protein